MTTITNSTTSAIAKCLKTMHMQNPEKWLFVRQKLQSSSITNAAELKALLNSFADVFEQQMPSPNFGFVFEIWEKKQQQHDESRRFFSTTLPKIVRLCLDSETLFGTDETNRIALHSQDGVQLSVHQCASLVACAFFGVAANPCDYFGHNECHSRLSLTYLTTERASDMMRAILLYFENVDISDRERRITMRVNRLSNDAMPNYGAAANDDVRLLPVLLNRDDSVDDVNAVIVADFANELIGGGVQGGIRAQEELLFCTRPECLVSLSLFAKMEANETISIINTRRFASFVGRGRTLSVKQFVDQSTQPVEIIAFDALVSSFGVNNQWMPSSITRDLNKAYIAFSRHLDGRLATGGWGTGAFGGNKTLKFFQQLIAASVARRRGEFVYCAFADAETIRIVESFNAAARPDWMASALYAALSSECARLLSSSNDKELRDSLLSNVISRMKSL